MILQVIMIIMRNKTRIPVKETLILSFPDPARFAAAAAVYRSRLREGRFKVFRSQNTPSPYP